MLVLLSFFSCFETKGEAKALTFFRDDFSNLNNWTPAEGEWDVSNGVLEGNGSGEALIWAGNVTWTNYNVTANIRMFNPTGDAALVVRYTDLGNFYWVGLGCWGHKYSITKVKDYVHTELAYSGNVSEVELGRWYMVSLSVVNTNLRLFVDGAKVLEVDDYSLPNGAIGFGTYDGTMQAGQIVVQSAAPTISPTPNYDETSEYLIGRVAVGVILLESNGTVDPSTENWTPTREAQVINEIQTGLSWLANAEPNADVSFFYDIHYGVPTSYEPINHPSTDEDLWINEAMKNLGYSSDYFIIQVIDYINALREDLDTDWAFAIFVVDSLNDPDGCFTNDRIDGRGKQSAYACLGGPFFVMTYDNGGYGISNMDYVTVHEACHIFYATDEYNGVTEKSGYLGIYDLEDSGCIMEKRSWLWWWLCTNSKQQLGWRDSDKDGLQDIIDTYPDSTLHPFFPEVTNKSVLNYSGFISETPYPRAHEYYRDITINTISAVEFRVDGGAWQNAIAEDGAFDEAIEEFFFSTPTLSEGFHTIETRGENSVGNTEPISDFDNVIVDISPPITNISFDGSMGNNDWVLSDVAVSLSATDSISSMDKITYSFDNFAWMTYTTPFLITQEGSTTIYYKSTDLAGNVEPVRALTTKIDKTGPVGSIIINDNVDYATSNIVTLAFSTVDTTSGVVQMRLSDDGMFDSEPWEAFIPTKSWNLSSAEGLKTIYAQFKDEAGLISNTYSDVIILDQTAPSGSVIINNGEDYASSRLVTLSLNYNDVNGVNWVRYSNDGVWDTEPWETPTLTKEWSLTSEEGTKTVHYQIKDNAGLVGTTYSDSIILEAPSPTPTPTPSPSPTPTVEPTPTPTPTTAPTPTPSPTKTPPSTESPPPTPTPPIQPTQSPTPPPSNPPLLLYGFIGGTIILFAVILAFLLFKKSTQRRLTLHRG